MKNSIMAACLAAAGFAANPAHAAELEISIQNLTRGVYFTPLLVTTHPEGTALFSAGQPASMQIRQMAEGGDTSGLQQLLGELNCTFDANPAGGLLAPAQTATTRLTGGADTANPLLSVVGMILPSNDGFVGLNAIRIPADPGTYHYTVAVYDAGTEANDEIRGSGTPGMPGMPVPPPLEPVVGINGSGVSSDAEGFIHIHRGVLGDTDARGGRSDIDSQRHRWMTPAARVTVIVHAGDAS